MAMILPSPKIAPEPLVFSALVVDTLDAERLLIIDRKTGSKIAHYASFDGINIRILPKEYALGPTLTVIIYDDDNQYNAAITDNVQTMLINMFEFDKSNPQPYESPA